MDPQQRLLEFAHRGLSPTVESDVVIMNQPWDLNLDPHALIDEALGQLRADSTLLFPMHQRVDAHRWPPDPSLFPELTALHLRTVLESRFAAVDLFHQAGAKDWVVIAGEDPRAERLVARARQPLAPTHAAAVSVVIPVYNRSELTEACLLALARHGERWCEQLEVIVIDNASQDQTASLLQRWTFDRRLRVRVIRNRHNLGFAIASNQGALVARGEVVVFLNNDTEVHSGWLEPLVDELANHPDTGCVGARLLFPDGTLQHAGVAIGRNAIPYHIHAGKSADDPLASERRAFPVMTGACLAVRRVEFLRLGMFDQQYINGTEDIDLCLRYRQQGQRCIYRPESVTTHHEGKTEGRLKFREQNIQRLFDRWRESLIQDDFQYSHRLDQVEVPERPFRFAIKIGVPNRQAMGWGDSYFAEGLARALTRQGHAVRIDVLNEWGRDDRDIDVVVHIKGLTRYIPKPWNVNLIWMISHPSLHTAAELEQYDAVLVASRPYAEQLRQRLRVPVIEFLQATDPTWFSPSERIEKRWDLVFVGNNSRRDGGPVRKIIADVLPTPYKLGVWGADWEGVLPPEIYQGAFVPPEKLPELYSSSWIVLNDHHHEMREFGFVNNRTFDAAACSAMVVCDDVRGLKELLPVHSYRSKQELAVLIERLLRERADHAARARALRPAVQAQFSFEVRARELIALANLTLAKRTQPITISSATPLVSILMATKDRHDLLALAIDSIRRQRYPHWELRLVNDGGQSVRGLVAAQADPRIELTELDQNVGKGAALGLAANASRGAYLAHQDDDDIWRPDHLAALIDPLTTVPSVRFSFSSALDVHLERSDEGSWVMTKRILSYERHVLPEDLFFYNWIQGITVCHDRALYFEAGGYDPRLKVLIDWDLWRRMAAIAPPYFIGRVTAERTYRTEPSSGGAHLTRLVDRDPIAYYLNRLRILRKPLPYPPGSPQQSQLARFRSEARAELLVLIGDRRLRGGEIEPAIRAFARAAAIAPQRAPGWRGLGLGFLKAGCPQDASTAFANATRAELSQPTDYLYGAMAALAARKPERALELLAALDTAHRDLHPTQRAMAEEYRSKATVLRTALVSA
jgi:GT2 family glycosyltransferase